VQFIVLVRGRNCDKTLDRCLTSLQKQTYPHWRAMIVLDAPTDKSNLVAHSYIAQDSRFDMRVNLEHLGLCGNMYNIIHVADRLLKPGEEDVAAIVDADDRLSKYAFEKVAAVYRDKPKTLVTHGSYVKMSKGRRTKISRPNPRHGSIRKLPWRSSHLKTVKWKIIKQAVPEWFQHKGEWLEAASDLALMFGCIEIAGLKRVEFVKDPIYLWFDNVTEEKKIKQSRSEKMLRAM
jgi:glycosyltransferase involved in cell wall biosynthesis